jgi:hypothetical protein
MTGDSAVLEFCRPFANRDGIDDLTACLSADTSVLQAADAALGPKMSNQLFFQRSPRLDEQATVNGFVPRKNIVCLKPRILILLNSANSSFLITASRSRRGQAQQYQISDSVSVTSIRERGYRTRDLCHNF